MAEDLFRLKDNRGVPHYWERADINSAIDARTGNPPSVDDMSSLRDVDNTDSPSYVLLSHTTTGDGGGGFFRWDAASTDADDDGTIILPTGHVGAGRWVREINGDWVSVRFFGAQGDGVTDDTSSIQAAIDSGYRVYLPPGTYAISEQPGNVGILVQTAGTQIWGAGRYVSTLVFTASNANTNALEVDAADRVTITDLGVDNTASSVKGSQTLANVNGIYVKDSSYCRVENCYVTGGAFGVTFYTTGGTYGSNDHNHAIGNRCYDLYSTGFYGWRMQYCLVAHNHVEKVGSDCFKITQGTRRCRVVENNAVEGGRDGFDLYDGFIESVLQGNVAQGCDLQGFEIKGTFGGTYGAGDYVIRDSTFASNIATGNGLSAGDYGFSVASVVNCTFCGNQSVSNAGGGFSYSNILNCTFTGETASKNTLHGYNFNTTVSRCVYSGCAAVDNSWAGGTTQNGTYHGFNLADTTTSVSFSNCMAVNLSTAGIRGGQGYGWYWEGASTGCSVLAPRVQGMASGDFGGDAAGWADSNYILQPYTSAGMKGWRFSDDALTILGSAHNVTIEKASTAELKCTNTAGSDLVFSAQGAQGNIGTVSNHPLRLTVNSNGILELSTSGHLAPLSDGIRDLGTSSLRYRNVYADKLFSAIENGVTGSRPGSPSVGQLYFDTTLGQPVWYDGANWVDATGSTV